MRGAPLAADWTRRVDTASRSSFSLIIWAPFWCSVGLINALLGARVALGPTGSKDLRLVSSWVAQVGRGLDPYGTIPADYPPWALVMLAPLQAVPAVWLPAVWVIVQIALGVAVAWLGCRLLAAESRPPLALAIGSLFAWAGFRIGIGNGQFTLLSLASGLGAVVLARCGSPGGGVLLAVALIKPQIGLAFAVWAALERRIATLAGAAVTLGAAVAAFCVRVHEPPAAAMAAYLRVVEVELTGDTFRRGSVELRPLLADLIGFEAGAIVTALIAAVMLPWIAVIASRASDRERWRMSLPLACLWTLASVFHNIYDVVLLWPVWIALWQLDRMEAPPAGAGRWRAFVQVAMVLGLPGLWWKATNLEPAASAAVGAVAANFDRLLVLGLLAYFLVVHRRFAGERS